jgi:thioredoxin reductase
VTEFGPPFIRLKERNAHRMEDRMRSGKVKVLFNSNPVEFKPDAVTLEVNGSVHEVANDFVWIFAGGAPPTDFLKKIGVEFGMRDDMTLEASKEARQSVLARQQPGQAQAAVK